MKVFVYGANLKGIHGAGAALEAKRICHDDEFEVTPIGCGLAGLLPQQIAPMFANAPANVHLPDVFKDVLVFNGIVEGKK